MEENSNPPPKREYFWGGRAIRKVHLDKGIQSWADRLIRAGGSCELNSGGFGPDKEHMQRRRLTYWSQGGTHGDG